MGVAKALPTMARKDVAARSGGRDGRWLAAATVTGDFGSVILVTCRARVGSSAEPNAVRATETTPCWPRMPLVMVASTSLALGSR